jgi:hypothetical protein
MDNLGTNQLSTEKQIKSINISDSKANKDKEIMEIASSESYKLLGVEMVLNGNTQAQATAMASKCHQLTKVFNQAPLN